MDDFKKILDAYGPSFMTNIAGPVWEAAVRQALVQAVNDVIWTVVLTALAVFLCRLAGRLWKSRNEHLAADHDKSSYGITSDVTDFLTAATPITYAVAVIVGFVALSCVTSAVQYLVNPQYSALQMLASLVVKK